MTTLAAQGIQHLKLYHYPATRSARVRWALHETVGDAFELETVPLYEGVQYQAEFLAKNPNHAVPVLEVTRTDGTQVHLLESMAIVQWLIDGHPALGLAPPADSPSLARADYLQMLVFGGSWMDMMLWQVRIHEHILPADERDPRTAARYRSKFIKEVEPQLLARLARGPFICGEAFSGADIIVGHCVTWARGYQLCADEAFRGYLSRLSKRPAFQLAFSDVKDFRLTAPEGSPLLSRFSG